MSRIEEIKELTRVRVLSFLREPEAELLLRPGDSYEVVAARPHLVTNAGRSSLTFLVLQGIGVYDYIPLD